MFLKLKTIVAILKSKICTWLEHYKTDLKIVKKNTKILWSLICCTFFEKKQTKKQKYIDFWNNECCALNEPSTPYVPRPGACTCSLPSITYSYYVAGVDLESVVTRESGAISSSLSSLAQAPATASVPVIVRRCIEEVERRGLDIIGLYRLCGSASKKRILREAFERNPRTVDLSPDNVPDINVITGQTIAT